MNQQEYDDRLDTMADELLADYDGENPNRLREDVHEYVDSSQMVQDVDLALDALRQSHIGPEEWHHMVADGDSWRHVVRTMAFDAVRTDLWAELRDRGVEM